MRKIRLMGFIIISFCAQISLGQTKLFGNRLQKLTLIHPYHCDAALKRFEPNFILGELPIKLLFLSLENNEDSLRIKGRVADYTAEGMPADIYLATISDSSCVMEEKLMVADQNGHFGIIIKKDKNKSLYFTSPFYNDLEIKLSEIIALVE